MCTSNISLFDAQTHTHSLTHTHTHTYTSYIHTYTNTHAHIYTHTHTQAPQYMPAQHAPQVRQTYVKTPAYTQRDLQNRPVKETCETDLKKEDQ